MKLEQAIKDLFKGGAITLEQFEQGLKTSEVELSKVVSLHDGEYVSVHKHKDETEKLASEIEALKNTKKELEKNAKDLETKLTGNEEALKTLEEYKEKNKAISDEYADYKKKVEIETHEANKERYVKEALTKNGCTSDILFNAMKGDGKYASLEYKDGEIKGLSEAIEAMKTDEATKGFFVQVEPDKNPIDLGSGGNPPPSGFNTAQEIMGNIDKASETIMAQYQNRGANLTPLK